MRVLLVLKSPDSPRRIASTLFTADGHWTPLVNKSGTERCFMRQRRIFSEITTCYTKRWPLRHMSRKNSIRGSYMINRDETYFPETELIVTRLATNEGPMPVISRPHQVVDVVSSSRQPSSSPCSPFFFARHIGPIIKKKETGKKEGEWGF